MISKLKCKQVFSYQIDTNYFSKKGIDIDSLLNSARNIPGVKSAVPNGINNGIVVELSTDVNTFMTKYERSLNSILDSRSF